MLYVCLVEVSLTVITLSLLHIILKNIVSKCYKNNEKLISGLFPCVGDSLIFCGLKTVLSLVRCCSPPRETLVDLTTGYLTSISNGRPLER